MSILFANPNGRLIFFSFLTAGLVILRFFYFSINCVETRLNRD